MVTEEVAEEKREPGGRRSSEMLAMPPRMQIVTHGQAGSKMCSGRKPIKEQKQISGQISIKEL
jgi:hypothetical protein